MNQKFKDEKSRCQEVTVKPMSEPATKNIWKGIVHNKLEGWQSESNSPIIDLQGKRAPGKQTIVDLTEEQQLSNSKRCSSTRKDVVYQTIFRYLKKFYQFMFQRFAQMKGSQGSKSHQLKLFTEYVHKLIGGTDIKIQDLMLHIGSIICPSNIQQLEQKIFVKGDSKGQEKARWKVALSILRYREMIQKFNLDKMKNFFKDPIYSRLFRVYSHAILSGRFQMPEIMQKNKCVYTETFRLLEF